MLDLSVVLKMRFFSRKHCVALYNRNKELFTFFSMCVVLWLLRFCIVSSSHEMNKGRIVLSFASYAASSDILYFFSARFTYYIAE